MTNPKLIEEDEIRFALLRDLAECFNPEFTVREEFRIERGASRIDVVAIGPKIIGYEIKSDRDSFGRFSNQIHAFNRVFDEIILVCGPTHEALARETVPSWWGLSIAHAGPESVSLKSVRSPGHNPMQDPYSLASLLWKSEARAILTSKVANVPASETSHALWERMVKTLSMEALRRAVLSTLRARQTYRELAVRTM